MTLVVDRHAHGEEICKAPGHTLPPLRVGLPWGRVSQPRCQALGRVPKEEPEHLQHWHPLTPPPSSSTLHVALSSPPHSCRAEAHRHTLTPRARGRAGTPRSRPHRWAAGAGTRRSRPAAEPTCTVPRAPSRPRAAVAALPPRGPLSTAPFPVPSAPAFEAPGP